MEAGSGFFGAGWGQNGYYFSQYTNMSQSSDAQQPQQMQSEPTGEDERPFLPLNAELMFTHQHYVPIDSMLTELNVTEQLFGNWSSPHDQLPEDSIFLRNDGPMQVEQLEDEHLQVEQWSEWMKQCKLTSERQGIIGQSQDELLMQFELPEEQSGEKSQPSTPPIESAPPSRKRRREEEKEAPQQSEQDAPIESKEKEVKRLREDYEVKDERLRDFLIGCEHAVRHLDSVDTKAEFNQIDQLTKKPCGDFLTGNLEFQNRFSNVLPYEHSIVQLPANIFSSNTYINASWINLPEDNRRYIATQAPTQITEISFWHMAYTQKVDHIVMLSSENPDVKNGYCYWPQDSSERRYGTYTVRMKPETMNGPLDLQTKFMVREFVITPMDGPQKTVRHYQIVNWPDFGVVSAEALYNALELFNLGIGKDTSPIVVHCTAGVGRTGTYIAADHLLRAQRDTVNLAATVTQMRMQRVLMLQTAEQYDLVIKAIKLAQEKRENPEKSF